MIKKFTEKYKKWTLTNQTVRELSRLTDRELSDIGIYRTDIKAVASQTIF